MNAHPTRQQLEKIAEERRMAVLLAEKITVLAQPHRRGDDGDMTDSFGIFLRHKFGREEQDLMRRCWEAGQRYTRRVSRLRGVKGVPQHGRVVSEYDPSGEVDDTLVAEWAAEIRECENAMKCSGLPGFRAAQNLVLDDKPPPWDQFGPTKRAIIQLAICLGFCTG